MKSLFTLRSLLFSLVLLAGIASCDVALAQEIGEQARERISQPAEATGPSVQSINLLMDGVKALGTLLVLLVAFLLLKVAKLVDFDPLRNINASKANGVALLLFGILFLIYVVVDMRTSGAKTNLLSDSASEHGVEIDQLMWVTIIMTGAVFFITQILLFYFSWRYRAKEGQKALFYHDNTKLETAWTLVPALALAVVVLFGVIVWQDVMYHDDEEEEPMHVELVGEQFQWRIRYAGMDNKLGHAEFKYLTGKNPLGVDTTDAALQDDIIPMEKKLILPVNKMVKLHIRAKDVLHGVYMPHFRVNMYAVPGMPTEFHFRPTVTTAEMREIKENPEFVYEMACSQLCGASHYNMRVEIEVVSEEEYKKFLATADTYGGPANLAKELPATPEGENEAVAAL